MPSRRLVGGALALGLMAGQAAAYRVRMSDTDALRETCSGMYGGKQAHISVSFDDSSTGQVALVIYEWADVRYLGVETPTQEKTYICTSAAVRSGLCTSGQLGQFITSLPANSTSSIYTSALKFDPASFPPYEGDLIDDPEPESGVTVPASEDDYDPVGGGEFGDTTDEGVVGDEAGSEELEELEELEGLEGLSDPDEAAQGDGLGGYSDSDDYRRSVRRSLRRKEGRRRLLSRQIGEDEGFKFGVGDDGALDGDDEALEGDGVSGGYEDSTEGDDALPPSASSPEGDEMKVDPGDQAGVVTYDRPVVYQVPRTGYYCVGIVPVTLVNSQSSISRSEAAPEMHRRQSAVHAEYNGEIQFVNTFDGELPAAEYPKIDFYLALSVVYFALGCGWAYLCVRHLQELLPMQYYISGTILFLVIEMLAQFTYYRYINKHGGGSSSLAFLFVIAILNAARNSLSFFLLLIVSMGLSVVTQSLGGVMGKVRALTGMHFVFGVLYSVGTVQVELDRASLIIVLVLIFPLALTLTAFLMWIIISLNGTILHLQARKQRVKLAMFRRLWRILVGAVIAVAAFFVLSSLSLSNRLDEDYAPRNWRYRWILLDGSLSTIYLVVFGAIAWIWRPTRTNRQLLMSSELAQDEGEADAEDYEIEALERGVSHQPLPQDEGRYHGDADGDEREGLNGGGYKMGGDEEGEGGKGETVFAMGSDSEDEGPMPGKMGKRD